MTTERVDWTAPHRRAAEIRAKARENARLEAELARARSQPRPAPQRPENAVEAMLRAVNPALADEYARTFLEADTGDHEDGDDAA